MDPPDTILTLRSHSGDMWSINKLYTNTKEIYKHIPKDIYIRHIEYVLTRNFQGP